MSALHNAAVLCLHCTHATVRLRFGVCTVLTYVFGSALHSRCDLLFVLRQPVIAAWWLYCDNVPLRLGVCTVPRLGFRVCSELMLRFSVCTVLRLGFGVYCTHAAAWCVTALFGVAGVSCLQCTHAAAWSPAAAARSAARWPAGRPSRSACRGAGCPAAVCGPPASSDCGPPPPLASHRMSRLHG